MSIPFPLADLVQAAHREEAQHDVLLSDADGYPVPMADVATSHAVELAMLIRSGAAPKHLLKVAMRTFAEMRSEVYLTALLAELQVAIERGGK